MCGRISKNKRYSKTCINLVKFREHVTMVEPRIYMRSFVEELKGKKSFLFLQFNY
jgi:hypothetical protein